MVTMKKTLKCRYKNWNGHNVDQYKLDDLWASAEIVETHIRIPKQGTLNLGMGAFQNHQKNYHNINSSTKYEKFPFKKKLEEDLVENGLKFPIILVKLSYYEISKRQKINEDKGIGHYHSTRPFWHQESQRKDKFKYSIFGGSQRANLAKELGYTHIDAILVPDVDTAYSCQYIQNGEYRDKLYGGGGVTIEQLDTTGKPTRVQ